MKIDGLEYLLRVNKYYEDQAKWQESAESDSNNKRRAAEALRHGDHEDATKAVNNIKDKAKKNYAKMQLKRKKEMEKQNSATTDKSSEI